MIGLPNPYIMIGGGLLFVAAIGSAYLKGDSVGANRVIARDAKAMANATKAMNRAQGVIEDIASAAAPKETARQDIVREIYHEATTIMQRPAMQLPCLDPDGVRLVDRAVANANGGSGTPVAASGPASAAPQP
jgi:hypothetical protein